MLRDAYIKFLLWFTFCVSYRKISIEDFIWFRQTFETLHLNVYYAIKARRFVHSQIIINEFARFDKFF